MDDRTADQPPIRPEQRRSSRFSVVVPVEVKWQEPSGKIVKQAAQAKEVNAQGGLLEMKIYPWVGGDLELTNLLSGQTTKHAWWVRVVPRMVLFLGLPSRLWFPMRLFGV